ncbi:energy transducer TonB [Sunxiuqinia sp. A32]|uniref:energy transducer TonB n=1 Tax=Sunxiuqinia sp. A32 TaxID=3461496 RepID=UPI0040455502
MKTKKTKKADLEGKRPLLFAISMVLSLGFVLLAFSWKTPVEPATTFEPYVLDSPDEIFIPRTKEEKKEIAPPPKVVDIIELVSNETEIEDEDLDIFDTENNDEGIDVEALMNLSSGDEEDDDDETIYYFVDEKPEFPGGMNSLLKFISNSVKYPIVAQENGIQGKVIVGFVVNKDGEVSDATVMRNVDASLDKEALRVVNMMPKWKPGKQSGRAVRVRYVVPISFVLQ